MDQSLSLKPIKTKLHKLSYTSNKMYRKDLLDNIRRFDNYISTIYTNFESWLHNVIVIYGDNDRMDNLYNLFNFTDSNINKQLMKTIIRMHQKSYKLDYVEDILIDIENIWNSRKAGNMIIYHNTDSQCFCKTHLKNLIDDNLKLKISTLLYNYDNIENKNIIGKMEFNRIKYMIFCHIHDNIIQGKESDIKNSIENENISTIEDFVLYLVEIIKEGINSTIMKCKKEFQYFENYLEYFDNLCKDIDNSFSEKLIYVNDGENSEENAYNVVDYLLNVITKKIYRQNYSTNLNLDVKILISSLPHITKIVNDYLLHHIMKFIDRIHSIFSIDGDTSLTIKYFLKTIEILTAEKTNYQYNINSYSREKRNINYYIYSLSCKIDKYETIIDQNLLDNGFDTEFIKIISNKIEKISLDIDILNQIYSYFNESFYNVSQTVKQVMSESHYTYKTHFDMIADLVIKYIFHNFNEIVYFSTNPKCYMEDSCWNKVSNSYTVNTKQLKKVLCDKFNIELYINQDIIDNLVTIIRSSNSVNEDSITYYEYYNIVKIFENMDIDALRNLLNHMTSSSSKFIINGGPIGITKQLGKEESNYLSRMQDLHKYSKITDNIQEKASDNLLLHMSYLNYSNNEYVDICYSPSGPFTIPFKEYVKKVNNKENNFTECKSSLMSKYSVAANLLEKLKRK